MTARSEYAAANANANGRASFARFPIREFAALLGVVLTATGMLIAGMQWAVSTNVAPLHLSILGVQSEIEAIRGEVAENRVQIADLRERAARVETALEQVQVNQVRILDLLERGPHPRE